MECPVFDLFSDVFAGKDNLLTRMDARVKMLAACTLILCVLLSGTMRMPAAALLLGLGTMAAVGVPARIILLRLAAPLSIVLVLVMLQMFLTKGAVLFRVSWLDITLSASREGLMQGCAMGIKVLGSVAVVTLLGCVTPAHTLFHALRWFRIPRNWVEIALFMYRYTFMLLEQTADVAAAQRLRLGYSGWRRAIRSLGVLAGTVLTRSMDQAMRTYDAMVLRGYNGRFPFAPLPRMRPVEVAGALAVVCGIGILFFILERWLP